MRGATQAQPQPIHPQTHMEGNQINKNDAKMRRECAETKWNETKLNVILVHTYIYIYWYICVCTRFGLMSL